MATLKTSGVKRVVNLALCRRVLDTAATRSTSHSGGPRPDMPLAQALGHDHVVAIHLQHRGWAGRSFAPSP